MITSREMEVVAVERDATAATDPRTGMDGEQAETDKPSTSRRALLAGALGGLGAWVASALGRAAPVSADGEAIVVGGEYTNAQSATFIQNSANSEPVLWADSLLSGPAVVGTSKHGSGVNAFSSTGRGVHGGTQTGVGVFAIAEFDGVALQTKGRLQFIRASGVASIAAGNTSVTVKPALPVSVRSGSFVLLTPTANIGSRALWYTTDPANGTFTIRMSSTRSSTTRVAWLLLG